MTTQEAHRYVFETLPEQVPRGIYKRLKTANRGHREQALSYRQESDPQRGYIMHTMHKRIKGTVVYCVFPYYRI